MLRRPVALLRLQHRSVWGVDRAHTPQRRQPSTTAATTPHRRCCPRTQNRWVLKEGSHLRRLQLIGSYKPEANPQGPSKPAAIYDGCNLAGRIIEHRPEFLKEGSHLRRLQLGHVLSLSFLILFPQRRQPSTTAATWCRSSRTSCYRVVLKEGSHLRRLQPAPAECATVGGYSSKKAAIYDGCN